MEDNNTFKNSFVYTFFQNSLGTNHLFFINVLINIVFGTIYSFRIIDSNFLLLLFGIVLPIIYIIGLYRFIIYSKDIFKEKPKIIKLFISKDINVLFMLIDISITVFIALLIYYQVFDYVIVRLIITTLLPVFYQMSIKIFLTIT
ncbi:MAG: hypothetical protein KAT68_09470 [Bacteroidales bacterium]|nr:hypothetical protein [Bacteroidales bacterium]